MSAESMRTADLIWEKSGVEVTHNALHIMDFGAFSI